VEPEEQCDKGFMNGTPAACCTATCQFSSAGSVCDDHDACTQIDQCDGSGHCIGTGAVSCGDDHNPCTSDTCDPVTGCQHPMVSDGTPCDDTTVCNGQETCQAGACKA